MEMFYLIVAMWTYSATVIPEKYTLEQCEAAGKAISVAGYRCVPAPKSDGYCSSNIPGTSYIMTVPCGNGVSYNKVCHLEYNGSVGKTVCE
jgi:hypothetical protein